jgi:hypothetical protein
MGRNVNVPYRVSGTGGGSLIDKRKLVFRRGTHQFESLVDVAESAPDYLLWLYHHSRIGGADREIVGEFIENHPDYFDEEEL